MTIPVDLKQIDELVERLRAYDRNGEHGRVHHEAADTIEAQASLIDGLRSALERLQRNFDLLLAGKPVRDVCETKAEVSSVLAKLSLSEGGE